MYGSVLVKWNLDFKITKRSRDLSENCFHLTGITTPNVGVTKIPVIGVSIKYQIV